MSHLDILLPFGLPPAELSADLYRELKAPSLATLTARARSSARTSQTFEDFHRALPHEIWLTKQFGLENTQLANSSPPIAVALMQSLGLNPKDGMWFVLQPVHIHIARDHLVLTDPRQLQLPEQEARRLFDVAKPLFDECGKDLMYGNAEMWFVRADDWSELQTATPDAAAGHNIDIWMPKGSGERDWRKVQNEVQMHWFTHPVNTEREATGRKIVNSVWLWGGATVSAPCPAKQYKGAFNLHGWMQAFSRYVPDHAVVDSARELISSKSKSSLLVVDSLIDPALSNDWGRWLDYMHRLESDWFAPILQGLKSGELDQVSIVLTNDSRLTSFTTTRPSLRKFWVKPSLAALCP